MYLKLPRVQAERRLLPLARHTTHVGGEPIAKPFTENLLLGQGFIVAEQFYHCDLLKALLKKQFPKEFRVALLKYNRSVVNI